MARQGSLPAHLEDGLVLLLEPGHALFGRHGGLSALGREQRSTGRSWWWADDSCRRPVPDTLNVLDSRASAWITIKVSAADTVLPEMESRRRKQFTMRAPCSLSANRLFKMKL